MKKDFNNLVDSDAEMVPICEKIKLFSVGSDISSDIWEQYLKKDTNEIKPIFSPSIKFQNSGGFKPVELRSTYLTYVKNQKYQFFLPVKTLTKYSLHKCFEEDLLLQTFKTAFSLLNFLSESPFNNNPELKKFSLILFFI